ncbi:hypothetical protein LTR37_002542 [Vermiconidia calcicola]|uniref:Uncharacterized protein n=1 Tax=Vermiconidia calcicola TaxID=1690605 RepID=A0ACC3NS01_9PEZI|nr:hypothetical protein LTR37_002542 [Vermiconidia calcicola]
MAFCNSTLTEQLIDEQPLWKGFNFHHFGLFLSATFALIATCIGLFLILAHATHYLKPYEQRHIIRILLLIPVYSVVSFLSYLYYQHAIYFDILEGCYEAFAISSFFTLLCHYIAPNLHDQKDYFRTLTPVNWFWGVFGLQLVSGGQSKGPFRKPRSGLTWFNIIWIGVFQYCLIRVLFTVVAVIAQLNDVYCEESLSPTFAHVWVQVFEAISVTIAMFCLIQFYIQLKADLAEHRPFLKVLCIKLVIFFSFWQSIVISFASSDEGPLQPTKTLAYADIKVGIPSVLLCIEMSIFAIMHIFAFPWKPYSIKHSYSDPINVPGTGYSGGETMKYKGGPLGILALADAFNPWDIIKMTARGLRWLFVGVRQRHDDVSYQKPTNLGSDSSEYMGPAFANSGETATELRSNDFGKRERSGTLAEDDRAGLLRHSAYMSHAPGTSPYQRGYSNDEYAHGDDSQIDLGRPAPQPPRRPHPSSGMAYNDFDLKPSDFDSEDNIDHRAYHPMSSPAAAGAGPGAQGISGGVHPAFRQSQQDWNFVGGARQQSRAQGGDGDSIWPPTYRTRDSYG